MSLTLITGPANSAKAGAVLDAHRAALARAVRGPGRPRDRAPLLVVPTVANVAHYERELAESGVVFGGQVRSFDRLISEIARRAGYTAAGVAPIGALQRERLVAAAVARARLRVLAPSAASRGFVGAAVELVVELERALVEPARLARALRDWAGDDAARRAYGEEVAVIYGGYRRGLERLGRVDADLFAWRALDALRAAPACWGGAPVAFYGFDDLTTAQRDAVEALARAAEVTVSLPYEPGRAAFAGRAWTYQELRPLADREVELPARAEHYARAGRAALHHVERSLFESAAPRRDGGDGAVCLLEAGGERAEAELVAAEILALRDREGVPAEEIAVVYRAPERSAALVEQVLADYGVAFTCRRTVPFAATTLGRAALGLLRCALPGVAADAGNLLAWLRAPGTQARPEAVDALEARMRREGSAELARAREEWGEPRLGDLHALEAAAAAGPGALIAELRRSLASAFGAPHHRRAPVLAGDEAADARALAAADRALAEVGELAGADLALVPAGEELVDALARAEVRVGEPARPGAVLVAGPLAIRARRYRVVFLCGLQEGEFPARGRAEPFLSDRCRREIAHASGLVLRGHEDRLGDERYLFYACAARPSERLYLSYRTADEEGNVALPSFFVDDVRELFDEDLPREVRSLAAVTWPADRTPTDRERDRARALAGPRVQDAPIAPLRDPAALALVGAPAELSPGALECFAECPVKWLVERRLAPRALEPDAEHLVRGELVHRVLARALTALRERTGSARVTPESLPAALRAVGEALAEERPQAALAAGTGAARGIVRGLEADLARALRAEARAGSAFEPEELECSFDGLELGNGSVRVRGRIDRVDVDPAGRAVVRDYKSGRAAPAWNAARWTQDRRIQVALYLLAVRRRLGLEPVAGLYQPLRGDDRRPRGLVRADAADGVGEHVRNDVRDPDAFAVQLAAAEELAVELVGALRAGRLTPQPGTCGWGGGGCAYPRICRGAG